MADSAADGPAASATVDSGRAALKTSTGSDDQVATPYAPAQSGSTASIGAARPELARVKTRNAFKDGLKDETRHNATLSWHNLSFAVPVGRKEVTPQLQETYFRGRSWLTCRPRKHKLVLNSVSGSIGPGDFVAILGPSGCGKTSLLNLLSGRMRVKGRVTGDILVNGHNVSKATRNRMTGYVMQDDILLPNLTVREQLLYTARLRLSSRVPSKARRELVDNLLEELNLYSKKDTKVGSDVVRGVSGGERKRVNIANEMVVNPQLLLLDEPTTGLDSTTAMNLIETLSELSEHNYSIMCTIHQPRYNIFAMFKTLCLMTTGCIVYYGPASGALAYFEALSLPCPKLFNPADFLIDIVTVETRSASSMARSSTRVKMIMDKWRATPEEAALKTVPPQGEAPVVVAHRNNWFHQVWVLTQRNITNLRRDKMLTVARAMQTVVMMLLIGLLFLQLGNTQTDMQNLMGYTFYMQINAIFGVLMIIWTVFPQDRRVFWRERASGMYHTSAWLIARWIVELPINATFPFFFTLITYWMVGLQANAGLMFLFIMWMVLLCWVAESFSLFWTTLITKKEILAVVNGITLIPLIQFGGFYSNDDTTPVFMLWAKYLSFLRYSFEGAITAVFHNLKLRCTKSELIDPIWDCCSLECPGGLVPFNLWPVPLEDLPALMNTTVNSTIVKTFHVLTNLNVTESVMSVLNQTYLLGAPTATDVYWASQNVTAAVNQTLPSWCPAWESLFNSSLVNTSALSAQALCSNAANLTAYIGLNVTNSSDCFPTCPFTKGDQFTSFLGFDFDTIGQNIAILFAMFLFYRFFSYVFLRFVPPTSDDA